MKDTVACVEGLAKSRYTAATSITLSIDPVISSEKTIALVRNGLPLVNPRWLFAVTFSSFMCLDSASRRICYITFPWTQVRLTALQFPTSSFHFLKMDVTFPIFQSSGISSDFHGLSKMMSEASQWQDPAFLVLLDASCLVPFPQVLPDIVFFCHGYCFTPTASASRLLGGTWEALTQALAVKTKPKITVYLGLEDQPLSWAPLPSRAVCHKILLRRSLNKPESAFKFKVLLLQFVQFSSLRILNYSFTWLQ